MFDEEKCLILDKNKNDITNKVFGEKDGKFMVSFNSAKPAFAYNKFNLTILENPVLLSDFFFSTSYQTLNNVQKALQFDDYIKIFFKNGKTKVYLVSEIIMKKNLLCEKKNKDLFLYLKELADNLTIEDMDSWNENKSGEKISILKKNYEKMSYVQEESVLKNFFSLNKSFEKKGLDNYIYPFSFNLSQQKAVNNAFKNTISIIEGPPGTGKTQTILNILSNAILNNKTVAVLSNNNSATDNVYEKLEKRGLASLCAKLGKKKNVEKFLITQSKEKTFPDSWNLDESAIQKYLIEMKSMELKVRNYLIQKNEIALLEQELSDLLLEYEHFKKSSKNILNKEIPIPNFSSKKLHSYLIFLNKFENKGIYFDNFIQIISQIRYPFINPKLYHFSIEDIFTSLEVTYYERRINEIQHKLGSLNQGLLELDLKSYFDKYTELSLKIFQSYVYGKYRNKTIFSEKEVKNTKNFIKEYPIILSTTYSILNCVTPDFLFDYMIIDESSQVDLVSAFPALSLAKNIVVVGDSKQLPNIIDSTRKEFFDELFLKYDLPEKFNYTQNSLLGLTKELV